MNASNRPLSLPNDPIPQPSTLNPQHPWSYWIRRLLVCNPFFLCSAALLLYGINRLSIDPEFPGDERANLIFNFSTLQLYELLIILTAVMLFRRRVWYDSSLLVVLDQGLLLVPFMLLSQASLIGAPLAWVLSLVAGGLAIARFAMIRRWFNSFNFPTASFWLGGAFVLTNLVLPRLFRSLVELDLGNWKGPNLICWQLLLPLLVAGANLLPRPRHYGGLNPERSWLPLFIYGLWVIGTAVHLWTLSYIAKLPFELSWLAPTFLVAIWTLWNRVTDCLPSPVTDWRQGFLILVFVPPFFGATSPYLISTLLSLNIIGYWLVARFGPDSNRRLARELALASLPWFLLALPNNLFAGPSRGEPLLHPAFIALVVTLLISVARLSNWKVGLIGSFVIGLIGHYSFPAGEGSLGVQGASIFLLVHSLGWKKSVEGTSLRAIAAIVWFIDSLVKVSQQSEALPFMAIAAGALLLAWGLVGWWEKKWPPLIIGITAAAVELNIPLVWLFKNLSEGLAAMTGSLALFFLGVLLACFRRKVEAQTG